jgi:hypothetical protein
MEDGNFWHLGGVTRWNSQFFINTLIFLAIIYITSQLFLCLFWISLWLRKGVYNTLALKFCVKLLKPPKIQIPTPSTSFRICWHIHDFTPCSLHSHITNSFIWSLPYIPLKYRCQNYCYVGFKHVYVTLIMWGWRGHGACMLQVQSGREGHGHPSIHPFMHPFIHSSAIIIQGSLKEGQHSQPFTSSTPSASEVWYRIMIMYISSYNVRFKSKARVRKSRHISSLDILLIAPTSYTIWNT